MKDARIKIIKDTRSGRVDFEIYGQHFHTNTEGEGLWLGYDYTKQVRGTMDFSLCQKSNSGKRAAIEKLLDLWSCFLEDEAYEKELEYQWKKRKRY